MPFSGRRDSFASDTGHDGGSVSIDDVQALLDGLGFNALAAELQNTAVAQRGSLEFRLQDKQAMVVTHRLSNVRDLARANAAYPLRFTSQFACQNPFFLVFIIHPWFEGHTFHQNFANVTNSFGREIAANAFRSFVNDATLVEGIPRSEAIRLLSGIVFLNGWPSEGTDAPQPRPFARIFLNSSATHRLKVSDFSAFTRAFGDGVTVEQIDVPRAGGQAEPTLVSEGRGVIDSAVPTARRYQVADDGKAPIGMIGAFSTWPAPAFGLTMPAQCLLCLRSLRKMARR